MAVKHAEWHTRREMGQCLDLDRYRGQQQQQQPQQQRAADLERARAAFRDRNSARACDHREYLSPGIHIAPVMTINSQGGHPNDGHRWMWMDPWTGKRTDRAMDGWMDGWVVFCMDGWMDGWMHGWIGG